MTLPTITDVFLDNGLVIVVANFFFKYTFDRERLEKWLEDNNMFDWISDTNRAGEHYQESGTMTFDEWFDSKYVEEDIIKAIDAFGVEPEQL